MPFILATHLQRAPLYVTYIVLSLSFSLFLSLSLSFQARYELVNRTNFQETRHFE